MARARTGLALALAAAFALLAAPASAATYLFHFENDSASVNSGIYDTVVIDGTFTTAGATLASAITGITGTVSGTSPSILAGAISGLSSYAAADNTLYATGSGFSDYSFGGVSFTVTNGAQTADYNLFNWNSGTYLISSLYDPVGYPQSGTNALFASVTAVPEPATWAMLLLGFGGIGFMLRGVRRREGVAVA